MLEGKFAPLRLRVLVVDDELTHDTAEGRAARLLVTDLESRNLDVIQAISAADGMAVVTSDAAIHAVLMDWTLDDDDAKTHEKARGLLNYIRGRNDRIPIFLMAERKDSTQLPVEVMQIVDEFIWTLEDTASFVSGRVEAAARRYIEEVLPPFAAALGRFARVHEYSWHTPGHTGGTAFLKSPVGRVFYDYVGENVLRSDLSISVGELGSLLDHTGPIGESEKYAARVFGAHRTYCVTNGTSTANRLIFTAAVTRDQIALCDRNCHKSIEHGLTLTGAIPTYYVPLRNRWGIIGPIHPDQFKKASIDKAIASNPLVHDGVDRTPVYSVVTNSTYDGLCYNAVAVEKLLDGTVDRVHWDEAWYGYARFNPIYRNRHGMRGDPKDHNGPTVFATHSTHKLLAALSQASYPAHPRRPRRDPARALQRVVHDARVDVAAVHDHRVERHHDGDDGRPRRTDADQRVHRGGGRVPADDGPPARALRQSARLVLQYVECDEREGARVEAARARSTKRRPTC